MYKSRISGFPGLPEPKIERNVWAANRVRISLQAITRFHASSAGTSFAGIYEEGTADVKSGVTVLFVDGGHFHHLAIHQFVPAVLVVVEAEEFCGGQ